MTTNPSSDVKPKYSTEKVDMEPMEGPPRGPPSLMWGERGPPECLHPDPWGLPFGCAFQSCKEPNEVDLFSRFVYLAFLLFYVGLPRGLGCIYSMNTGAPCIWGPL